MSASSGFGVTANIIVTGSTAAIVDIEDVDLPEQMKFLVESTVHGVTGSYSRWMDTGQKELSAFPMTILWDAGEVTHSRLLGCFNLTSGVAMSIVTPGSDETIYFACHIEKIGRVSKQKDKLKATITVRPSGPPTIS